MAYTSTDVERLERAIASGHLSVRYADRTVTYQGSEEMKQRRLEMIAEIAAAAAGTSRKRTFRVTQSGTGF